MDRDTQDTVELYWPRESAFVDHQSDLRCNGEGVYEVPARWEAHYRRRGWEDPPEDEDAEAEQPESANNPNLTGPTRDELEGADPDEVDDAVEAAEDDGEGGGDTGN